MMKNQMRVGATLGFDLEGHSEDYQSKTIFSFDIHFK